MSTEEERSEGFKERKRRHSLGYVWDEGGGTLDFGRILQSGSEPAFWEEILDSNFIEILQV